MRRRAADLGRLEPRALLVPLEVVRQRLVVALDAPEGREEGAHLGRLADADGVDDVLEERLRRAPLEDGQRVRRRVVRRDALAGLVQLRPVELRRVQDRGLVDAHIFEELLVHVVVLADGRERHVARRRDLVLDDAQPVFPDELAEGPSTSKSGWRTPYGRGPSRRLPLSSAWCCTTFVTMAAP